MSKFTPGRWHYLEEYIPEGITLNGKEYLIQSESREDVALVWTEADARLIARAPEMYRLLLSLLNRCVIIDDCAFDEIKQLIARIDGKEEITAHEGTD